MAEEIEKKYRVQNDEWRALAKGILYRQGYLADVGKSAVRVRVIENQGFLTIKEKRAGIKRLEYEYAIPLQEANEMLEQLCHQPIIEKYRYQIPLENVVWEVDEFLGANAGLIVAEVELESEEQRLSIPSWVGKEITEDQKYYNANLNHYPYSQWTVEEKTS